MPTGLMGDESAIFVLNCLECVKDFALEPRFLALLVTAYQNFGMVGQVVFVRSYRVKLSSGPDHQVRRGGSTWSQPIFIRMASRVRRHPVIDLALETRESY